MMAPIEVHAPFQRRLDSPSSPFQPNKRLKTQIWDENFEQSSWQVDLGASKQWTPSVVTSDASVEAGWLELPERRKVNMKTGCIPCLMKGVPCDPSNQGCRTAMSEDWSLNPEVEVQDFSSGYATPSEYSSLSLIRTDTKWKRRNWRERHSLNFFVNFSAPQMAGFFDSAFWQRMVIQTSFYEPAILHAITAIGALHEAILQRALADEKRKTQAMEFALGQCNRAISQLRQSNPTGQNTRLALTTCVLFTCFEAMQGRCDSAVAHALQGRRLLQASGRANATTLNPGDDDNIEQMRPLVERLEVQATALLDKGKRPAVDTSDQTAPLPPLDFIFSLDHAHNTLHTAMNSVMRFMQGFHPTAPRDHIAVTMAEKYLRYAPWFQQWEAAFTTFLSDSRPTMTTVDLKRAMVLKANHLVGTMLAAVDQSAGPAAYDAYEAEFKAIVDLSREVLATYTSPPLPTLSGNSSGTPYLSFSLWVTDPLWMAISRCRNSSVRQAAFTLLSQNPRQEGIWHAGPLLSNNKYMRRSEAGPNSAMNPLRITIAEADHSRCIQKQTSTRVVPVKKVQRDEASSLANNAKNQEVYPTQQIEMQLNVPESVSQSAPAENMKFRSDWIDLAAHEYSSPSRGPDPDERASPAG